MAKLNSILTLLVSATIISSCNTGSPGNTEASEPRVYRAPYDTVKNSIAGFIAGTGYDSLYCLPGLDSASIWRKFRFSMDSGFSDLDTSRFDRMRTWADKELRDRHSERVLFYPFGGPDILNANIFYPNASSYILFGLEPVGELPGLCSMDTEQVNKYLEDVWYSLKDIFKRSYFITGNMIDALKKSSVNGTAPVISMFLKRSGYNIVSLDYVSVDTTGRCMPADSLKGMKGVTRGVKIEFATDTGRRIQSVFYFQTDISDEGLRKNPGFNKYLGSLPETNTYIKAASYLMHGNDFSEIRNLVFEKSLSILQDDSGIAYKLFDKSRWDIKLYGKYQRPGKEFSWINETDLAAAYQDTSIKPVPFTLGYNWRTRAINLLYAVRRD